MNTFSQPTADASSPRKNSGLKLSILSASMAAVMGLTGCETPGQTALAGAAAGAAIGGAVGRGGRDVVRGAAIGAGAGYLTGRAVRNQRERAYNDGYYDSRYENRGYRRVSSERRVYSDRRGDRYYQGGDGREYYVD